MTGEGQRQDKNINKEKHRKTPKQKAWQHNVRWEGIHDNSIVL